MKQQDLLEGGDGKTFCNTNTMGIIIVKTLRESVFLLFMQ